MGCFEDIIKHIMWKFNKEVPSKLEVHKPQDLSNVNHKDTVDNKKSLPIEGGKSQSIGDMWNLKHDINSTKFYLILIKYELK